MGAGGAAAYPLEPRAVLRRGWRALPLPPPPPPLSLPRRPPRQPGVEASRPQPRVCRCRDAERPPLRSWPWRSGEPPRRGQASSASGESTAPARRNGDGGEGGKGPAVVAWTARAGPRSVEGTAGKGPAVPPHCWVPAVLQACPGPRARPRACPHHGHEARGRALRCGPAHARRPGNGGTRQHPFHEAGGGGAGALPTGPSSVPAVGPAGSTLTLTAPRPPHPSRRPKSQTHGPKGMITAPHRQCPAAAGAVRARPHRRRWWVRAWVAPSFLVESWREFSFWPPRRPVAASSSPPPPPPSINDCTAAATRLGGRHPAPGPAATAAGVCCHPRQLS